VQILWVVSQPQPTWEKRLPSNVAAIINAARRLNPPTDNSRIMGGIQTAGEMVLSLISNIVSKANEGSWLGERRACGCSVRCVELRADSLVQLGQHQCILESVHCPVHQLTLIISRTTNKQQINKPSTMFAFC
jgi:hypothetical protein